MNKTLSDLNIDIRINGIQTNNLRYTDNTVLLAETLKDLKRLIIKVVSVEEKYGYLYTQILHQTQDREG